MIRTCTDYNNINQIQDIRCSHIIFINTLTIFYQVNCAWGDYSAYSGCTKTCGGGKQYRFRTILTHEENGGIACVGTDHVQEAECNTDACPAGNFLIFIIILELCII